MSKKTLLIIVFILASLLAIVFGWEKYQSWKQIKTEESSTVLLEKIQTVAKLTTVEGSFSEIYDYKDYWGYDFSPFRKKALVRTNAIVAVGYDLEKMVVTSLPDQQKIIIKNFPPPSILSIDHDMDYYDITQGSFNSFSEADYNKINKKAKEAIREKAGSSNLFKAAEKQRDEMLEMVKIMTESIGWTLEIEENALLN